MSKVTVVGAGAVGATCANVMACREVASEVVLIDIKEGLSEGKMLDMYQCSTLMDFDTKLVGVTNDYKQTANSDVVVITSGIPRKPGISCRSRQGRRAVGPVRNQKPEKPHETLFFTIFGFSKFG